MVVCAVLAFAASGTAAAGIGQGLGALSAAPDSPLAADMGGKAFLLVATTLTACGAAPLFAIAHLLSSSCKAPGPGMSTILLFLLTGLLNAAAFVCLWPLAAAEVPAPAIAAPLVAAVVPFVGVLSYISSRTPPSSDTGVATDEHSTNDYTALVRLHRPPCVITYSAHRSRGGFWTTEVLVLVLQAGLVSGAGCCTVGMAWLSTVRFSVPGADPGQRARATGGVFTLLAGSVVLVGASAALQRRIFQRAPNVRPEQFQAWAAAGSALGLVLLALTLGPTLTGQDLDTFATSARRAAGCCVGRNHTCLVAKIPAGFAQLALAVGGAVLSSSVLVKVRFSIPAFLCDCSLVYSPCALRVATEHLDYLCRGGCVAGGGWQPNAGVSAVCWAPCDLGLAAVPRPGWSRSEGRAGLDWVGSGCRRSTGVPRCRWGTA